MFGRKKDDKVQRSSAAGPRRAPSGTPGGYRGQIGLLDVPDLENMEDDDGGGDSDDDLEAELMALQAGHDIRKVISRHRLETEGVNDDSKQEESEDDEDITDPDLLAELNVIEQEPELDVSPPRLKTVLSPSTVEAPSKPSPRPPPPIAVRITPVAQPVAMVAKELPASVCPSPASTVVDVLQQRIELYKTALANAKTSGDISKGRRLERGLKTLESMLRLARAGKPIAEEDIPPPVAVGSLGPVPNSTDAGNSIADAFKSSHSDGNLMETPNNKNSDVLQPTPPPPLPHRVRPTPSSSSVPPVAYAPPVIEHLSQQNGSESHSVDEDTRQLLLTRRGEYRMAALAAKKENNREMTLHYVKIAKLFDAVIAAVEAGEAVDLSDMPPSPSSSLNTSGENKAQIPIVENDSTIAQDAESDADSVAIFNAPPPPTSILESLEQRLQKYRSAVDEAQSTDNASKSRRMARIVKQYEDAIKAYKAKKPVNFEELPTPPGFAPIPVDTASSGAPVRTPAPPPPAETSEQSKQNSIAKPQHRVAPSPPSAPSASTAPGPTRSGSLQRSPQALHEKQHAALVERQQLFKDAALDAKRRGDIQAAKEYLKLAKGFEPMIKASLCGLPVNMDSVPLPPQKAQEAATFELVSHEDCEPVGDRDELFEKLDKELIAQIEMCATNRSHFAKIGDVQSKKKFETLLLDTKKDLDFVRHANKGGYPVPRFHYETRTFSIVRCNTELGDDDLELSIIRGINYACSNPNEVDTFVRFEFPYPETPQKDKTQVIRNTNNPEYNAVFKLSMNRKNRAFTRVIKRQGIKFEIWAKGGFLRSDISLGSATVKLAPLETRCSIHDSFDLMDGRKPIGGKLEVQIRIRDPILNKQVETLCEKWLVVSGGHATQL